MGSPFIVSAFRRVAIPDFNMLFLSIHRALSPTPVHHAFSFSFRIRWRYGLWCSAPPARSGGLASSVFRWAGSRGLSRLPILISNFACQHEARKIAEI